MLYYDYSLLYKLAAAISKAHPYSFHALPHIAYNASYSPQNALYWLFVFSWYNFHSYVKNDYSSILPPKQKWLFNGSYISPSLSITSAYSLIKNSRPKFLMVGFIYFCITKV